VCRVQCGIHRGLGLRRQQPNPIQERVWGGKQHTHVWFIPGDTPCSTRHTPYNIHAFGFIPGDTPCSTHHTPCNIHTMQHTPYTVQHTHNRSRSLYYAATVFLRTSQYRAQSAFYAPYTIQHSYTMHPFLCASQCEEYSMQATPRIFVLAIHRLRTHPAMAAVPPPLAPAPAPAPAPALFLAPAPTCRLHTSRQ
jgi:hypothetical protein